MPGKLRRACSKLGETLTELMKSTPGALSVSIEKKQPFYVVFKILAIGARTEVIFIEPVRCGKVYY